MSFGIRLEGQPRAGNTKLWRLNAWWWPSEELREEVDLVEVSSDPGYRDFAATVDRAKAQALAKRFRPRAKLLKRSARRLAEELAQPECTHVVITVFEWTQPPNWIPPDLDRERERLRRRWNALRPPPADQRWRASKAPLRKVEVDHGLMIQVDRYYLTDSKNGPYYEVFQDDTTESIHFVNPQQPAQDHRIIHCFEPWMDKPFETMITADILLSGYAEPPITFNKVPTT